MESIPDNARGVGHGNLVVLSKLVSATATLFGNKATGNCSKRVQALGQARGIQKEYTRFTRGMQKGYTWFPPIRVVLVHQFFVILAYQGASRVSQIVISCDLMAWMIAAGLTVGCKDYQRCQEKENN